MYLEPEPELISLIHHICSLVVSMEMKLEKYVSLHPNIQVPSEKGYFKTKQLDEESYDKWKLEKAPVLINHPLHEVHPLKLVLLDYGTTMSCRLCHEDLKGMIYCCSACNFAVDVACLKKPIEMFMKTSWHGHQLTFFPIMASIQCRLCGLTKSNCPFYVCAPCAFVVHQKCISLPHVIKISRHPHRICLTSSISSTPSFGKGDSLCYVCRKKIDGGYYCPKDDCLYVAHSKCATHSNVWDGKELEGEPQDEEEAIPFEKISDRVIKHFSHQQHLLRLDENTGKDYDDSKQCQACVTPIYFGNFYSCTQCDFILHEACANLSRIMYHPLNLVEGYDGGTKSKKDGCSACGRLCMDGFYYKCCAEGCQFMLNVQCAAISEPFVTRSHMHPLFLTSRPGDWKQCSLCNSTEVEKTNETFNCIENGCEFSMCFSCAIIPQKVRYKHDAHTLTLSYPKERSHVRMPLSWCEVCQGKVYSDDSFYECEEYNCVTLHLHCLLGKDRYMRPGSSWSLHGEKVDILPNSHMSRPTCEKRCPQKIVFQMRGKIHCSTVCTRSQLVSLKEIIAFCPNIVIKIFPQKFTQK